MAQEKMLLPEPSIVSPIGRAGVGKSTFVTALAQELQRIARLSVVSPSAAGYSVPRYAFRTWRQSLDALMLVRKEIAPDMHKGLRDYGRLFRKLLITERVIRHQQAGRDDVVVIDEFGVFHTVLWLALRASEKSPKNLDCLFACDWFKENLPDLLILCDLDEQTTLERRRSRSKPSDISFLQSRGQRARFDANYEVFRSHITRFLECGDDFRGMEYRTLDMSAPTDHNVQLVVRKISERLFGTNTDAVQARRFGRMA